MVHSMATERRSFKAKKIKHLILDLGAFLHPHPIDSRIRPRRSAQRISSQPIRPDRSDRKPASDPRMPLHCHAANIHRACGGDGEPF
jgi:hypothetical protein